MFPDWLGFGYKANVNKEDLTGKYNSEEVQKATKDFLSLFGRKHVIGKLKVALAENTELSWRREFRDMMNALGHFERYPRSYMCLSDPNY